MDYWLFLSDIKIFRTFNFFSDFGGFPEMILGWNVLWPMNVQYSVRKKGYLICQIVQSNELPIFCCGFKIANQLTKIFPWYKNLIVPLSHCNDAVFVKMF